MEERLVHLSVDLIDDPSEPLRQSLESTSLDELTRSIAAHGVLQPIRVRARENGYEVVAGQRRLAAARRAGIEEVPAVVVDADDREALLEALVENVQREDLNPIERAEALRRLRVAIGAHSWEEVGRTLGISRRHVHNLLNVADLPDEMRDDVRGGIVSEKHGRALMRLRKHPDLQAELWRRLTAARLSGDEALHLAREMAEEREAPATGTAMVARLRQERSLVEVVEALMRLLPRASMSDIRPLRQSLERLKRGLDERLARPHVVN